MDNLIINQKNRYKYTRISLRMTPNEIDQAIYALILIIDFLYNAIRLLNIAHKIDFYIFFTI